MTAAPPSLPLQPTSTPLLPSHSATTRPHLPINALFESLCEAFRKERDLQGGAALDTSRLSPEEFQRLDGAVRALMQEYTASTVAAGAGCEDWRHYAYFNASHYVRNLVDANEDFELMVCLHLISAL